MKSFGEFKDLCEAASSPRGVAAAEKALEDALKAQADASIPRYEDGKEIPKKNRYYLQNNPNVGVLHRIKSDAANAAVMAAQQGVTTAQQKVAMAQQQKEHEKAQTQQKKQQEEEAAAREAEAAAQAAAQPEPVPMTPEEQKQSDRDKKRAERDKKNLRKSINQAQQKGLSGKYN